MKLDKEKLGEKVESFANDAKKYWKYFRKNKRNSY